MKPHGNFMAKFLIPAQDAIGLSMSMRRWMMSQRMRKTTGEAFIELAESCHAVKLAIYKKLEKGLFGKLVWFLERNFRKIIRRTSK